MSKAAIQCTNKNKQMQANERHVFAWVRYSTHIHTHAEGHTSNMHSENKAVIIKRQLVQ